MQREPRETRQRRRFQVEFAPVDSPDNRRPGFTEDISAEGLFIQTGLVHPPRTRLVINLQLDGRTITLTGRVVWAKRAPASLARNKRRGMGVRLDQPCQGLVDLIEATQPA